MNYKVTVLGLGAMGLPMATRLATQLTVHGYDIAEPVEPISIENLGGKQ